MIGLDMEDKVSALPYHIETAYMIGNNNVNFLDYSVGTEYLSPGGLNLDLNYLYHGGGEINADRYDRTSYRFGHVLGLARNYLGLEIDKFITKGLSIQNKFIFNLDDGGMVFYPIILFDLEGGVDLSFEGLFFSGKVGTEYNPLAPQDPKFCPSSVYTKLRFYF